MNEASAYGDHEFRSDSFYDQLIAAIEIFKKYDPRGYFEADHDVIWGPGVETIIAVDDIVRLEELGWHRDSDTDSWARYV